MSTEHSCRGCRFRDSLKACRFNPPTVVVVEMPDGWGGKTSQVERHFPYMDDNEWCGRWESSNIIGYRKAEGAP